MPPQVDLDALARKLGGRDADTSAAVPPPPVQAAPAPADLNALATKLGGKDAEPPPQTDLQKGLAGAGIRAIPKASVYAEYAPIVGGTIGGLLGDVPGAFAGGMLGKRLQQYIDAFTGYHALPAAMDATSAVVGSGLEQGALEGAGKVAGSVLKGPLRPTAPADIVLAKANRSLGLRLTPSDVINKTATGMVGQAVDQMAERSVSGRVIGDLNRQVTAKVAREGIVAGKAALNQVGEALHQTVTDGPAYDMFPHRVEAAQIFADDVAPKILDLYQKKLPPPLLTQLQNVASGSVLSPDLVQKLIPLVRRVVQRGQSAPVPTGTLDALESILQTADTASFDSATKLRTSLLEIGRRDDAVMGDRGRALTKKFASDLTDGLSNAYPPWDPLRRLYASGAEAQRLPNVSTVRKQMLAESPSAYGAAVKAKTGTIASDSVPVTRVRAADAGLASTDQPHTWFVLGHLGDDAAARTNDMYRSGKGIVERGYLPKSVVDTSGNMSDELGNKIIKIPTSSVSDFSRTSGGEPEVLQNLRTIDDALSRVKGRGGQWGDRIYRIFELSSTVGAGVKYGPGAAASALAVTELLPGMIVWAAHNPTTTKLLQEGLTTRDLSKAATLLGRVTQSYVTYRSQQEQQQAQPAGTP